MAADKPLPGSPEPERFEPASPAGLAPELPRGRLPPGRHRLSRSLVRRNQRMRIVAAMMRSLAKRGYTATTIGHLTADAGVSRGAFYEQFADMEECFLATYDLATAWFCERIELAAAKSTKWPVRIRLATERALALLAANPELSHLFAVDVLHAGSIARRRQQDRLATLAELLRAGRSAPGELPAELEEMLLGGALSTIARYVDSGRVARLPEAAGELLEYLLLPYLGAAETRRIVRAA